jgi:hypothetical protein
MNLSRHCVQGSDEDVLVPLEDVLMPHPPQLTYPPPLSRPPLHTQHTQDSDEEVLVPLEDVLMPHPQDFMDAHALGLTAQVGGSDLSLCVDLGQNSLGRHGIFALHWSVLYCTVSYCTPAPSNIYFRILPPSPTNRNN